MPKIALPTGRRGAKASPKLTQRVENLIYQQGETPVLMPRPAVTSVASAKGSCRGMGVFRNISTGEEELYFVSSDVLYRLNVSSDYVTENLRPIDITLTEIGTIPVGGDCQLVSSFTHLCVLIEGGDAYMYDGTTLTKVTSPNYKPSQSVAFDAGRFVFVPSDGEPFFWTNTGDPLTIDAVNFADAESATDPNRAVIERKGSIYVLGDRTVEQQRYEPSQNVYVRVGGASASVGYVGGLTEFGETFAFLGRDSGGSFQFYVMGASPEPMGNDSIQEMLAGEYSNRELRGVKGRQVTHKGVTCLLFYLPDQTLAFYGDWGNWRSEGRETWRVNNIQSAYGFRWTGDSVSNDIGILKDNALDYGAENQWLFQTHIKGEPRSNFLIKRIYADCTRGLTAYVEDEDGAVVSTDRQSHVGLSISQDGRTFSPTQWRSLGEPGNYNAEVSWGSPVVKARDYCGIIIRGYGNSLINTDGVYFE